MSHLFKYGDVLINGACRGDVFVLQVSGIAEKNGRAQLVIQKTALDVAGWRDHGSRVEADDIPRHDSQFLHIIRTFNQLVQQNLHAVVASLFLIIFSVHMNGGVDELEGSGIDFSPSGDDPAVFSFRIIRVQPAQGSELQLSFRRNSGNHGSQRVRVRHQQNGAAGGIRGMLPGFSASLAQLYQHAALYGYLRLIAHFPVNAAEIFRRFFRIARRAVDSE